MSAARIKFLEKSTHQPVISPQFPFPTAGVLSCSQETSHLASRLVPALGCRRQLHTCSCLLSSSSSTLVRLKRKSSVCATTPRPRAQWSYMQAATESTHQPLPNSRCIPSTVHGFSENANIFAAFAPRILGRQLYVQFPLTLAIKKCPLEVQKHTSVCSRTLHASRRYPREQQSRCAEWGRRRKHISIGAVAEIELLTHQPGTDPGRGIRTHVGVHPSDPDNLRPSRHL